MITFGFNTIAMLTFGLGIRMPYGSFRVIEVPRAVSFRDKPAGFVAEEKTAPTSFGDISTEMRDKKVEFEEV